VATAERHMGLTKSWLPSSLSAKIVVSDIKRSVEEVAAASPGRTLFLPMYVMKADTTSSKHLAQIASSLCSGCGNMAYQVSPLQVTGVRQGQGAGRCMHASGWFNAVVEIVP
jgi:hypothetical protein